MKAKIYKVKPYTNEIIRKKFDKIQDRRVQGMIEYPLSDVLIIVMCSVISGLGKLEEIVTYAENKKSFLSQVFKINSYPSESQISRILNMVDGEEVAKAIMEIMKLRILELGGILLQNRISEKKEDIIMGKYDVSDYQWEQIKGEIAPKTSMCGRARRDPRELINAIVWEARTGAPWCELPKEYGPWHTAYNNFRKWTEGGTIKRIFDKVMPKREETKKIQLDATYIRAHQHSAGIKKIQNKAEGHGKTGRS